MPDHVGIIMDAAQDLVENRIQFAIHYPADNSAVFTVDGNLDQAQLKMIVALGGSMHQGKFRILVTESERGS